MNFHLVCIWPVKQIKSSCFLPRLNWLKEEKGEISSLSPLMLVVSFFFICNSYLNVLNCDETWYMCASCVFRRAFHAAAPHVCSTYSSRESFFLQLCNAHTIFALTLDGQVYALFWLIFPDNTNVASDAHKLFALTEVVLHFHLYTSISVDKCVQISG